MPISESAISHTHSEEYYDRYLLATTTGGVFGAWDIIRCLRKTSHISACYDAVNEEARGRTWSLSFCADEEPYELPRLIQRIRSRFPFERLCRSTCGDPQLPYPFLQGLLVLLFQHLIRMLYHNDVFKVWGVIFGKCARECLSQDIC